MALLDRIQTYRKTRSTARTVKTIAKELGRIADALERMSPPTSAPQPDSVEIEDPDPKFQRQLEQVERVFWQKYGRAPTADEAMVEYDEMKHLL